VLKNSIIKVWQRKLASKRLQQHLQQTHFALQLEFLITARLFCTYGYSENGVFGLLDQ